MIRQPQQGTATAQSHDSSPVASPRRRPTRSPSLSSSSITFTPATLSVENGKGVQDITRKVIRQLEGLGHLEVQDMDTTPSTPYGESEDGESVASASGHSTRRSSVSGAHSNGHATDGHTNGHAKAQAVEEVDYEIPRKLLHSSIGGFPFPGYRASH
jgi:diacylglycerol kinase (CTP)